jgi:hypothetical protein
MIHLPDCSVTDTHARGLRRAEDRWVDRRAETWKAQRNPRRFGPRVRQMHNGLLSVFGAGRVALVEQSKRSAHWVIVTHAADGLYRLEACTIERSHRRLTRARVQLPLAATAHCYERFIQGMLRQDLEWARTLHDALGALLTATDYTTGDDPSGRTGEHRWRTPGDYKVWLPEGLAVVEVPASGQALMRTVIASEALIGPNRSLWEELGATDLGARRFVRRSAIDWFEDVDSEVPTEDTPR